jgi:hypothetical protein
MLRGACVGIAAAITLVVAPWASAGTPAAPGTAQQVAALVASSVKINVANAHVLSELAADPTDTAENFYPNLQITCATATACVFGDIQSTKTVVLFGDSHARMWLPSIVPVAIHDKLKIVYLGQDGCPVVSLASSGTYPSTPAECASLRSSIISVINALKPFAVILADRTSNTSFTAAQWQSGFTTTLRAIAPSKAAVVVLGDIQVFSETVPGCIAANPTAVQKCSMKNPNPKMKGLESAEIAATRIAKDLYVPTTQWLCTTTKCSPVIGNYVAYWNNSHVSATYASYLSTVMGAALHKTFTGR